ncbi:acetyl-CoA carboxylase biotin carboxyl carrier protein [Planctomicrobium sp. SH664]|uniref:acetyl-CoA carboxylase biotin carboxyl carrier protein n=1 Tax=Planctomicrobium sp. SH664 TaxID=3448125 RepID=UPI003F5C7CF9
MMARETKTNSGSFDIDGLRQLLELMEKYDVREFKVSQDEASYVLRRGPQQVLASAAQYAAPQFAAPAPTPASAAAPAAAAPATPAAAPSSDDNLLKVKSPTVGTFYSAPAPGEPAFVKVGDVVKPDTVVCIVEAMKMFNQIPAGLSGTVVRILLNDGDTVEFGQPLVLVKPN